MKKFIKNITLFGVVLFGFLLICDAVTTYAFHQKTKRKYGVWNDIIYTDIDADVLIMGASRAWRQYSTYILDSILQTNTYNIGIDGSSFNRQLLRYDIYRHYQKSKPKIIIQNIDYTTLGYTIGYEREQFMPYMMYPYFRNRVCEDEPISFGELYMPMYRYYKNYFYDEYVKYDFDVYKGYAPEEGEWEGVTADDLETFAAPVDERSKEMFEQYIEAVQQEDIELIFVMAPILYEDIVSKVNNLGEINQMFYDLSEQYRIPLLDYSQSALSMDPKYFFNSTHLNQEGAELFSVQLAHDLDSLGIIQSNK